MVTPFYDAVRALGEDGGLYIVNSNGNTFQAYGLAWRYLGMFIDCDIGGDDDDGNMFQNFQRQRGLSNDENDCSRKVLWAAYEDPGYEGASIGEYQFYDWKTDSWDNSTCRTGRCARMDCHEDDTDWQLVGVFKETDGLTDWAEQLFKHQGYCLWDGDKEENCGENDDGDYDFMQNSYEDWMEYTGCNELEFSDEDGNNVYVGLRPRGLGDFDYGIYVDEACTQPSNMTYNEFIVKWYGEDDDYYYGYQLADAHEQAVQRWNTLMNEYKICQPCRAYNRVAMGDNGGADGDYGGDDYVGDEGGGNSEQWGYNCYDDAGYTNCNQCYKFETKTDLYPATTEDLERASRQGTILSIEVNGVQYGKGRIGYNPFHLRFGPYEIRVDEFDTVTILAIVGAALFLVVLIAIILRYLCNRKSKQASGKKRYRGYREGAMSARLIDDASEETGEYEDLEDEFQHKSQVIEEQEQELNYLQAQITASKSIIDQKDKKLEEIHVLEEKLEEENLVIEEQEQELNCLQAQIDASKSVIEEQKEKEKEIEIEKLLDLEDEVQQKDQLIAFLDQREKEKEVENEKLRHLEEEIKLKNQLLEEHDQELNFMQAKIEASKSFLDQTEKENETENEKVLRLENEVQLEDQEQEMGDVQSQIDSETTIDDSQGEWSIESPDSLEPEDAEGSELSSDEELQSPSQDQEEYSADSIAGEKDNGLPAQLPPPAVDSDGNEHPLASEGAETPKAAPHAQEGPYDDQEEDDEVKEVVPNANASRALPKSDTGDAVLCEEPLVEVQSLPCSKSGDEDAPSSARCGGNDNTALHINGEDEVPSPKEARNVIQPQPLPATSSDEDVSMPEETDKAEAEPQIQNEVLEDATSSPEREVSASSEDDSLGQQASLGQGLFAMDRAIESPADGKPDTPNPPPTSSEMAGKVELMNHSSLVDGSMVQSACGDKEERLDDCDDMQDSEGESHDVKSSKANNMFDLI